MEKQRGRFRAFLSAAYRLTRRFIHRPWFYDRRFLITLSVLSSVFLWATLAMNVSPVETKVIQGVKISINEEGIEDNFGVRFVEVISPESLKDKEFDIRVSGRKYLLTQLTASDFTAVASANKSVTKPGAYDFTVSVSCNNPLLDVTVLSGSQQMYVKFDRYVTKDLTVASVEVTDISVPANSGLIMGTPFSNVAKVSVEGPEAEVTQIASVLVRASGNKELSDGETFDGELIFKNEKGDELTLSGNATVRCLTSDDKSADAVTVTVPIKTSKSFTVDVRFKNAPDGFNTAKLPLTVSPESVTLVGTPDAIDNLSDTYIAGDVDLAQVENKVNTYTFDLSLPTGVDVSGSVEKIKVKLDLSKYSVESFRADSSHAKFDIVNYTGTREVTMNTTSLSNIRIIGPAHVVSKLKASDLVVEADMSGKETVTGSLTVPAVVSVKGHNNCWAIGAYEVDVSIN